MKKLLSAAEIFIIIVLALAPLVASFPYRINIFLSWEGAYRMAEGQLPYKDFGIPVGYMYWVIPSLFFKIFGAQLITLIKAQAFINIIAGLAFRSIARNLYVQPPIRFAAIIVFCLSYSFINYWPWYNHTVIVFQLISLAFLLKFLTGTISRFSYGWLILSAIFVFFSFFTKQDAGALAFLICLVLLVYDAWFEKRWKPLLIFISAFIITGFICILPFAGQRFGYWFNHGQFPHTSRISVGDILGQFLGGSNWLKFYLFVIVCMLVFTYNDFKTLFKNKISAIFVLLTLGILAEAAIFQVTSYVPEDNNIFFHSFAILFILSALATRFPIPENSWKPVIVLAGGALLWWSQAYYKYIDRFVFSGQAKTYEYQIHQGYSYATTVDRNTFMIELDTTDVPMEQWRVPNLKSFEKILLPGPTVDGIERLMQLDIVKNNPTLKLLNMTELTPLAAEVPFQLETGNHYPLWFHKGVGMFQKETDMFNNRIQSNHYDLVLYEYIPYLNNFYPYSIRESLQKHYQLIDRFPAPRKPSSHAWIEVYRRRS